MPASDVLPRPGGPASSTCSQGSLRARAASRKIDELLLDRLLADELGQPPRAQRAVELLLARRQQRIGDALGGRAHPPPRPPAPGGCAPRPAAPGRRRAAPPRPRPRSCPARPARRGRPCGRRRRRRPAAGSASGSAPTLSLRSITTRSAVFRPMPLMLVNSAWSEVAMARRIWSGS